MQTPDEIKRQLMTCLVLNMSPREQHEAMRSALLYIRRLEERNTSLRAANDGMLDLNGMLHRDMLEQRERADRLESERDAAILDMTKIVQENGEPYCEYCGADYKPDCTGKCWTRNEGFRWRGVQKEE